MKKKIIAGLGLYAFFFALVGASIIVTTERATSKLDNLIKLHQVEILREHLLLNIGEVQSDLTLRDTPYARSIRHIVSSAIRMDRMSDRCFQCHHSAEMSAKLDQMKGMIETYKHSLSRVITYRADRQRLQAEKDEAFRAGQDLIEKVNGMIALTSRNLTENTRVVLARFAETKALLFFLIASGPLLSAGLAYLYIRSLTKPVGVLLDATRKLEAGELDHRVPGLTDEFGELSASFNRMAGSLKEQMQKMQRTEQMVVVGNLAAGLGHEVKNPLAGIKAAAKLLSEELTLNEEDKALFTQIVEEVGRLEALMKGFLNFAKPPTPRWEKVHVNRLIEATTDFYLQSRGYSSADVEGIEIVKELDDRIPETVADPRQLQQVFLNLILNAVDAMADRGTLAVETRYQESTDSIRIDVRDSGKGIDPAAMDRIFQPFFTTKAKGTGLGLAICKQLVEQHGGSIHVENRPEGGACFHIVLPCRRGGPEADA